MRKMNYKAEFCRFIKKIKLNNEIMERDQAEINRLKQQSRETLKRIDINLAKNEATLRNIRTYARRILTNGFFSC